MFVNMFAQLFCHTSSNSSFTSSVATTSRLSSGILSFRQTLFTCTFLTDLKKIKDTSTKALFTPASFGVHMHFNLSNMYTVVVLACSLLKSLINLSVPRIIINLEFLFFCRAIRLFLPLKQYVVVISRNN